MRKIGFAILALGLLGGCGAEEDEGVLTADERQRLENIADRLDKELPLPEPTASDSVNEAEVTVTENLAD
jgi:hypothetical protein